MYTNSGSYSSSIIEYFIWSTPVRTVSEPMTEVFNPLTLELDIYSLAHYLCTM